MQRRSTYAQPTKIIKFEVVLAQSRTPVDAPTPERSAEVQSQSVDNGIVSLSDSSEVAQNSQSNMDENQPAAVEADASPTGNEPLEHDAQFSGEEVGIGTRKETSTLTGVSLGDSTNPRCWAGVETAVNLILPDRFVKPK